MYYFNITNLFTNKAATTIPPRYVFSLKKLNSFLVNGFTIIGVVAPFKNDPILSGRSRRLFRHLKLQNPSINSNFREIWEKK